MVSRRAANAVVIVTGPNRTVLRWKSATAFLNGRAGTTKELSQAVRCKYDVEFKPEPARQAAADLKRLPSGAGPCSSLPSTRPSD